MKNNYRKKIWISLLIIVILSLILRIDVNTNYPKGVDTYELYVLTENVKTNNYIVWNENIYTTFGLTSFSYPPGGIVFLSEISKITGLDTIQSIFIWNGFLIIIISILVYNISKKIFSKYTALILTIIYINTRLILIYSTFFTSRNIMQIIFLTIILIIISEISIRKKIAIIAPLIIISSLTHRSTILIGLFIITYTLAEITYKYKEKYLRHIKKINITLIIIGIILIFASSNYFREKNLGTDTNNLKIPIDNKYIQNIIQTIFSISINFGITIILAPIGLYILMNKKDKSKLDFFIILSTILGLALISETVYFLILMLLIITLNIGYLIEETTKNTIIKIATSGLIIFIILLPNYIKISESDSYGIYVNEKTIYTGQFLKDENITKNIICNEHTIYCSQIASLKDIGALTQSNGRTFSKEISLSTQTINFKDIRNKIVVQDNILKTSIYGDSYMYAITSWNTPKPALYQLLKITNVGYIIDSNNKDSNKNRATIEKKFENMNQIYDNGLQQVKVIN